LFQVRRKVKGEGEERLLGSSVFTMLSLLGKQEQLFPFPPIAKGTFVIGLLLCLFLPTPLFT
jgi:hypothetical protein